MIEKLVASSMKIFDEMMITLVLSRACWNDLETGETRLRTWKDGRGDQVLNSLCQCARNFLVSSESRNRSRSLV
jgi:hypothetical protein